MIIFNPLTRLFLVLNANPKGDNQYKNPDGPSVDWSGPKRPSIAPAKMAKGLAKKRTQALLDKTFLDPEDNEGITEHHLHVLKKILEGKRTKRYKKFADYSSPSSAHYSIAMHNLRLAKGVESRVKDSELAKDLTARAAEHIRASESYDDAKEAKKLNQKLFVKKSGDLIPVGKDYEPYWTPREYNEPD